MNLEQLCDEVDELYFVHLNYYFSMQGKRKELLTVLGANTNVAKLTYKHIIKYYNYIMSKNSPRTVCTKMSYLSKVLRHGYERKEIPTTFNLPRPKIRAHKERYLTTPEFIAMLKWTKENKQKELSKVLLIGWYTGLRINTILSLTNLNLADNILYIYDQKTNSEFALPCHPKIRYVIEGLDNGFELKYTQLYHIFEKMKKELELDRQISFHTLRHTFCSRLNEKGVPLPIIQKLANHKRIQSTMYYTHTNTDQLMQAIGVL